MKWYRLFIALGVLVGPFVANYLLRGAIQDEIANARKELISLERYEREHNDIVTRLSFLERAIDQKVDRVVAEQRDINRDTRAAMERVQSQLHELDTKLQVLAALDRKLDQITRPMNPQLPKK